MMTLGELIVNIEVVDVRGPQDIPIRGIACHSGSVHAGDLFVAVPGESSDGHLFIDEAVRRGARGVVVSRPSDGLRGATQVVVADPRKALARVSAIFYGDPSMNLTVVGITGTNGKTTCSYLIESVIAAAGGRPAVIGTINYRYGGKALPAPITTPESLDLQRMMSEMLRDGVTHLVLEVSSHALAMERIEGCHFDIAVLTNFGRDHLDYHKTLEAYGECKKRFFTSVLPTSPKKRRFQVINRDDTLGRTIPDRDGITTIRYGMTQPTEDLTISAREIEMDETGTTARIVAPSGTFPIESSLIGVHNLYNILAAAAAGHALGYPADVIREGIGRLEGVPGRIEPIGRKNAPAGRGAVFVDYAHTPDALRNVLSALRPLAGKRLITVFGCGGDRDRGKRPEMGAISLEFSDGVIVTTDNPRTEDPGRILEDIVAGMAGGVHTDGASLRQVLGSGSKDGRGSGPVYAVIPDRREAIRTAVGLSGPGDIVLIAGKGHEDYQILGRERVHLDDREEARKALNPPSPPLEKGGLRGDL